MMQMNILLLTALNFLSISVLSQNLPLQWTLNEEEHRLTIGGVELDGLYDDTQVLDIYLQFDQSNYEQHSLS